MYENRVFGFLMLAVKNSKNRMAGPVALAGDDGREHDPFFGSDKLCGHFRFSRMPHKRFFRGGLAPAMPVSAPAGLYHIGKCYVA
jgi:hypothetical protein